MKNLELALAFFVTLALTASAPQAYAQGGVPLWTNYYNGPGSGGQALALDSSGNVFVVGDSFVAANSSYVTIKYSAAGVALWTNRYDGGYVSAVAVDTNDDAVVTGYSGANGSYDDYLTIKYSGAGVPLWTNRYDGPGNNRDHPTGIAVDHNGNVFVTGYSRSTTDLNSEDYATIKYSGAGVPLWTNRYNGPANGDDRAYAIAVDGSGNVVVTGRSASISGDGDDDYATIKYSGAGVPLWTARYAGPLPHGSVAYAVAIDSSGNVFVTGESAGTNQYNYGDFATLAYSSAGAPLWTNRYDGGANREDAPRAIAVDRGGNVFVTGSSTRTDGAVDCVTIKYSSSISRPRIIFEKLNNRLVLSWTNAIFGLQSAAALTGTFTNLPGATSPFTNPISGGQQFFRLIAN